MRRSTKIQWMRDEFFITSRLHVPVLGKVVEVWVDPETDSANLPSAAQLRALKAFLLLKPKQQNDWSHSIALYCQETCQQYERDGDNPPVRLGKRKEVWKHVEIQTIHIPKHGKSRDRYVFVGCWCAWEVEHGLELLFKNEQLFKAGPCEGLDSNEEWKLNYINE
jgi:hypothetical protein